jgi:hypothetical protein
MPARVPDHVLPIDYDHATAMSMIVISMMDAGPAKGQPIVTVPAG